MYLQFVMSLAGTIPLIGYIFVKVLFGIKIDIKNYIYLLRMSIIFFLCPFQWIRYRLPVSLFYLIDISKIYGEIEKLVFGIDVVNIPRGDGFYYIFPERFMYVILLWLIIVIFLMVYRWGDYFKIKRNMVGEQKTTDINSYVRKNQLKIGGYRNKKIKVCEHTKVSGPCTIGWIRPYILMPEKNYSQQEKQWIIQHEITHIQHRDIFWKMLGVMVCIIHWYNFFVYFLIYQYQCMSEYYCDVDCTKNMDMDERKKYAILIVKYASAKKEKNPLY